MIYFSSTVDSPCGPLRCVVNEDGALTHIEFLDALRGPSVIERLAAADHTIQEDTGHTGEVESELKEYFAGERMAFEIETSPEGTPFQLQVWQKLKLIPYGETRTYGEIAQDLGQPGASRAVGAANGANPIPIVIPCHRVVGSDGTLVGFRGGLKNKARLLEMERRYWPTDDDDQLEFDF
jgi:methylated-DNA-[protein]-cysteine S-methyltransferase